MWYLQPMFWEKLPSPKQLEFSTAACEALAAALHAAAAACAA